MEIRSYRRVFDLERRIYRVDRMRLNPGGVPVRGVVYFLAILVAVLVAGRLPLVGLATGVLPWYLGDVAFPALGAAVLTLVRVEGRPFHLAAYALARYRIEGREPSLAGARAGRWERWQPEEIVLLPDGSDARFRRMRYTGPGGVLVAVEHEREAHPPLRSSDRSMPRRCSALTIRELGTGRALSRRKVIALSPGTRLFVARSERVQQAR